MVGQSRCTTTNTRYRTISAAPPMRVIPLAGSSSRSPITVMPSSHPSSSPTSRAALPIPITREGSANPITRLMVLLLTVALTTAAPRSRRARCAAVYAFGKLVSEARITPPTNACGRCQTCASTKAACTSHTLARTITSSVMSATAPSSSKPCRRMRTRPARTAESPRSIARLKRLEPSTTPRPKSAAPASRAAMAEVISGASAPRAVSSPKKPSVKVSLLPSTVSPRTSTSLETRVVIRQARKTSTATQTDMPLSSLETWSEQEQGCKVAGLPLPEAGPASGEWWSSEACSLLCYTGSTCSRVDPAFVQENHDAGYHRQLYHHHDVFGAPPVPGRGRAAGSGCLVPSIKSAPRAAGCGAHGAGGARDGRRLAPALAESAELDSGPLASCGSAAP